LISKSPQQRSRLHIQYLKRRIYSLRWT
jgi:hypothetical protein